MSPCGDSFLPQTFPVPGYVANMIHGGLLLGCEETDLSAVTRQGGLPARPFPLRAAEARITWEGDGGVSPGAPPLPGPADLLHSVFMYLAKGLSRAVPAWPGRILPCMAQALQDSGGPTLSAMLLLLLLPSTFPLILLSSSSGCRLGSA